MKTLPIVLIKDEADLLTKIKFETRVSEGAFGITFRITYNGDSEKYLAKVLSSPSTFEGKDVLKEALIGYELQKRLPDNIKTYFTATDTLLVCRNFKIPTQVLSQVKEDELKEKLENETVFYVIIQEFVSGGAKTGAEWLVDQKTEAVSGEIIRSIMFQLTIAFCYAQSILGFQHNDFKLENVMFIPHKGPEEKIIYRFPDGDLFQLIIPIGGVKIRVIDLGSASLYANDKEPLYIKATDACTVGYAPYEYLMYPNCYDADVLLESRQNDSDIKALFNIMINLIAHKRAVDDQTNIYLYEINQSFVFTDVRDETKTKLKTKLDFTTAVDEIKQEGQLECIIAETVLLKALGVLPSSSKDFPSYTGLNEETNKIIKKNFDILMKEFKTDIDAVKDFDSIVADINDTFKASTGLHFVRSLAKPFAQNRLSFGVPDPFHRYGLANLIYHPFFAYTYWIKDSQGRDVNEIEIQMDKPLGWQKEWEKVTDIPLTVTIAEDYQTRFKKETGLTSTTASTGADNVGDDDLKKLGIGDLKDIAKKEGVSGYSKFNSKTKGDLVTLIIANRKAKKAKAAAEPKKDTPPPPSGGGGGTSGAGKKTTSVDDSEETSDVSNPKKGDVQAQLQVTQALLKNVIEEKILQAGKFDGTEINTVKLIRDIMFTNNPEYLDEFNNIYYIRQKRPDGTYVPDSLKITKKWETLLVAVSYSILSKVYMGKLQNKKEDNRETVKLLKGWLGTYNDKGEQTGATLTKFDPTVNTMTKTYLRTLKVIDTNISFIQSSLESIEHAEISLEDINNDYYIPLKEHLALFPELEKVGLHMGLEKDNFIEAGSIHHVDMNNKYNQTRYLHTLSVLAGAFKEEHIDMDEIGRCYVEWPPRIPYKIGQVNEI